MTSTAALSHDTNGKIDRPTMRFKITCNGKPPVYRNEFDTDTLMRAALGDSAKTTALMMSLASGTPLTISYRGLTLTVTRAESR